MSSGAFTRSRYQSDGGTIHPIRVQPETLTLNVGAVNAAPTGTIDAPNSARVSGGTRQLGLVARKVRVAFTGTLPTGYAANSVITLPVMTPTVFNGAAAGTTGTYLGSPIVVVGRTSESVR